MERRRFVLLTLASLVAPQAAHAQSGRKIWRVGYLSPYSAAHDETWRAGFREGMRELGYVEGRNLAIEMRHAVGATDRLTAFARELVNLKIDLFLVHGATPAIHAAKAASSAIPIIFVANPDPVGLGFTASLARPGGNITGISDLHTVLGPKRLELLKEILPSASRIGILMDPTNPAYPPQLRDLQAAAPALHVRLVPVEMRGPADLPDAFKKMKQDRVDAFHILGGSAGVHMKRVVDFAVANRIPTIATTKKAAEEGILLSYGASFPELYRRAASYAHRIFKGAKAGELPIEQPTKFELVINLKTAKALGITISQSILARADEVIQ